MHQSPIQLSIIIPVYNLDKYLASCLDSILAQDFDGWEVIAVNDGSADGSAAILDRYAEKDARIRVLHKQNGGVSSARNAGLNLARGEFVGFVDGDDAIAPDMYSRMLERAREGGFDIVQCDYINLTESGERIRDHAAQQDCVWADARAASLACTDERMLSSSCNKIFRRAMLGELRFDESLAMAEDALFVSLACARCTRAAHINYDAYFYLQRGTSAIHQRLTEKQFGRMKVHALLTGLRRDDEELHYASAKRYAQEAFSLISMVVTQKLFTDRLKELRRHALANRSLLLGRRESGRRLRLQLLLLWLAPGLYYRINALRSRALGRK